MPKFSLQIKYEVWQAYLLKKVISVKNLMGWLYKYKIYIYIYPLHMAVQKQGASSNLLPEPMNDWEGWRERVRNICADGTTRWWYLSPIKASD